MSGIILSLFYLPGASEVKLGRIQKELAGSNKGKKASQELRLIQFFYFLYVLSSSLNFRQIFDLRYD